MAKILIVDDDEDLLEMMVLLLRANRLEVIGLNSGKVFFQTLDHEKPDFVIMDVFLDNLDGRELCRLAKHNPSYAQLPILLYSAGNVTSASLEKAGADDFLQKPFEIGVLMNKLNHHLSSSAEGELGFSS